MISNLGHNVISRVVLLSMTATLISICSNGDLLAQDSWRELPMPSMHLQAWGRPDTKGTTWVVPQRSGIVGVSHDGGATMLHQRIDDAGRSLTHAAVIGDDAAVVVGNDGAVFRTQDGGATWLSVVWNGSSMIRTMGASSRGSVVVVDSDNVLYRSGDSGLTFFASQPTLPSIVDDIAHSIDGDTLYAYGRQCPGFLISTDGGRSWERSTEPTSDALLGFSVGQDGALALIDKNGRLWLRRSAMTGWILQDSPWFTNSQWLGVSCWSETNMILMGGNAEEGVVEWLQRYRYDSLLGWKSEIVATERRYLDTIEVMSVPRGMLLITPSVALLIHKLSYADTIDYYRQKINVMQAPATYWNVHAIERTPDGTTLVAGSHRVDGHSQANDRNVQWIARHGRDGIDREFVTHFVVNSGSEIIGADETYMHSDQSSSVSGSAVFVAKASNRLLHSSDEGRTWRLSSPLPVAISSLCPLPISKYGEGWMLGMMKVDVADKEGMLTMFTSVTRGRTWDSLVLPLSPLRQYSGPAPVCHYATNNALGMITQTVVQGSPEFLFADIDLQRGTSRVALESIPYAQWFMLGSRYIIRYGTWSPGTVGAYAYFETYDVLTGQKEGSLDRDLDAESGFQLRAEIVSDSVAMIHGIHDMIFLTVDAGHTWREYRLPTIEENRKWDIVLIRRIKPGTFAALMRGRGVVERRVLVEFTLEWDRSVSVDTPPALVSTAMTIAPNPSVDGLIAVGIPDDMVGECSWHVVDILGRIVGEGTVDAVAGRRIMTDIPLLRGGYTFVLQSRAGCRTARFIVQP